MFVKRRPHLVNHGIWWERDALTERQQNLRPSNRWMNIIGYNFRFKYYLNLYHGFVGYCFIRFDAVKLQIQYERVDFNNNNKVLYTDELEVYQEWSHWNVYFESSRILYTFFGWVSGVPLDLPMLDQMNMHIVTRHQARFEATAIFMGYVRHVLKKHIATSDNLRVILQCIESCLKI